MRPASAHIRRSCHDNAFFKTIIGLFKAEVIHRHGQWRRFNAVEFTALKWVSELIEIAGRQDVFPDITGEPAATNLFFTSDRLIEAAPDVIVAS